MYYGLNQFISRMWIPKNKLINLVGYKL